jgi:hypothetical protein
MHFKFAKHVDTIMSHQNDPKPSYASTVKEGASLVLVASFADGKKPTEPLNVTTIERLLDVKSSSFIPQRVRIKDNNIYITFPEPRM